ncbi:DUF4232 domain-containing protein [Nocardia sp. NBC_00511]|uniref:DUF4232 domain-containing protein n=1 Tax=Nocardia sp. NBC_00511 TaxID=2903591 RepID=UPI0030E105AA
MKRTTVGVAMLAGAVLIGATGCSGSGSPGTPTTSNNAVLPVGTLTSADAITPSIGDAPGATSRTPAAAPVDPATPVCANGQIAVTGTAMPPNGTRSGVQLEFTSATGVTCRMTGFPTVDVLTMFGQHVHAQKTNRGAMGGQSDPLADPVAVLIKPGHPVHAVLEGSTLQNDGQPCPVSRSFLVSPPDTTDIRILQGDAYQCDVQIHPVG